jgi:hypothetical protein
MAAVRATGTRVNDRLGRRQAVNAHIQKASDQHSENKPQPLHEISRGAAGWRFAAILPESGMNNPSA